MSLKFSNVMAAACGIAIAACATTAQAELDKVQLEVIIGNHTDSYTTDFTAPFFATGLAEASGGAITAHAVPYTELGLSGFELMNLLKLGTNDISWGVIGYISGDSPISEGLELPGLTSDMATMFKAQAAYAAILEREYGEKFNAKPAFVYTQPRLQAYCRLTPEEQANFSLATLAGKKTRVHSTSFADFAEALGMVPVTMAFTDVLPALERGVLDCAITSPNAAYGYKWFQVVNSVVDVPAGYSTQVMAMNLDRWNGLSAETQSFLTAQFGDLKARMDEFGLTFNNSAVACLVDGPCPVGEPGKMTMLTLSDADMAALKPAVEEKVLGRWSQRCGEGCAAQWNETLGPIFGMSIK